MSALSIVLLVYSGLCTFLFIGLVVWFMFLTSKKLARRESKCPSRWQCKRCDKILPGNMLYDHILEHPDVCVNPVVFHDIQSANDRIYTPSEAQAAIQELKKDD